MSTPDVTVVVAVYNTMPYFTSCLTSLVKQTIDPSRLEVIVVDDGSTDGSGAELDRFAARYPNVIRAIHQPNSGGPAAPSNRALKMARGRYVFFLGADDYLGPEALERLVRAADDWQSDIVIGRVVGANKRYIHQAVFERTQESIDLFESALPWSLANTKLFRRELIEQHQIRFPEDMLVMSDQPFTLEACVRARKISVLADYDYYYAVRRENYRNMTYRTGPVQRLGCIKSIMNSFAELVGPGKNRDAVFVRHFTWEVAGLLDESILNLDREQMAVIHRGVRDLAKAYLSDDIRAQLPLRSRVRIGTALHGTEDDLAKVILFDAKRNKARAINDGGRWFAALPGFREPRLGMDDAWFHIDHNVLDWLAELDVRSIEWIGTAVGGRKLVVTAVATGNDLAAHGVATVVLRCGNVTATTISVESTSDGTVVRAAFTATELVANVPLDGEVRTVEACLTGLDSNGSSPVRGPWPAQMRRILCRSGSRFFVVTTSTSAKGHFVISFTPVTLRRILAYLRSRMSGR